MFVLLLDIRVLRAWRAEKPLEVGLAATCLPPRATLPAFAALAAAVDLATVRAASAGTDPSNNKAAQSNQSNDFRRRELFIEGDTNFRKRLRRSLSETKKTRKIKNLRVFPKVTSRLQTNC